MITDLNEFPNRGIYVAAAPGRVFHADSVGVHTAVLRSGGSTLFLQLNKLAEYGLTWADVSTTRVANPLRNALEAVFGVTAEAMKNNPVDTAQAATQFRVALLGLNMLAHQTLKETQ